MREGELHPSATLSGWKAPPTQRVPSALGLLVGDTVGCLGKQIEREYRSNGLRAW